MAIARFELKVVKLSDTNAVGLTSTEGSSNRFKVRLNSFKAIKEYRHGL